MKAYLELSELKQLEDGTTCLRDRLLIRLLARLGCRISEALAWWSNALGWPGLKIEKKLADDSKVYPPYPDALDMDGDGSTEPLTFIGGGTPMSYHDPFHMGIGNAAMIPPSEVWVDDDYFFSGGNDGHIWGLDAFAVIQDGIDIVAEAGTGAGR